MVFSVLQRVQTTVLVGHWYDTWKQQFLLTVSHEWQWITDVSECLLGVHPSTKKLVRVNVGLEVKAKKVSSA